MIMLGLYNLYIPVCALFIEILCNIVFFSKGRVVNKETSVFSRVLIYGLIDSALMVIIIYFGLFNPTGLGLLKFLNKIDYSMYILFASNLFLYVYYITSKESREDKVKSYNFFFILTTIIDILVIISLLFFDVNIHNNGRNMYSDGMALNIVVGATGVYFFSMIVCLIINFRKAITKKLAPLYTLILLFALVFVLNQIDKSIVIISAVIAYVNLIMLFTIENPDTKMLSQVESAKEMADKANKAKTDFLSSMSHEIRTPLNAIVGFSECIKNEDSLDKAKEDAEDIITASQNLLEIVNGILDISKIESGKMELVEKEYDLHELAENLAKLIKTRIGEKQITLNTYFAPDIPGVLYGDAGKVRQVMSNVLTNAVKYTEKGFIDFSISCVNDGNTSKLVISVEDTGRGIKPEKIDKLFNKFERLEEDKNTTLEGTGLGLAISKSLVEMMNGKIVVQSKYGEGSKFTIYIPQVIKSYVKKEVKSDISSNINLDLTNRKILIVDDNKLNLKIEARSLEGYHPTVTLVESGFETLEKIKNGEKYDLILMDDMMPKMSGTEAMKQLRTLEGFKTPVVVLTANAISGMKEKYLEDGFDDYLAKPLDKEELKRVLTRFLSGMDMEDTSSSIFDPLPSSIYTITDKDIEKIDALMPDEELRKREEALNAEEKNNQPKENKVEEVKPEEVKVEETTEEVKVEEPVVINEPVEISVENNSSNKGSREFLEQNGINVSASLELLGDMEMFNETIDGFIKETEERIPKMKEYKDSNNTKDYAILAHAMKSDSKYLGFTKLAELSLDHELKGKEDNINYINENYATLMAEVDRIMGIIKEYRG